jgi:hypothetical protein
MNSSQSDKSQSRRLELTRSRHDRFHYDLESVGSIRREGGAFSTTMVAESTGHQWRFEAHGVLRRTFTATNTTGTVIGRFVPRSVRRGGQMDWRAGHYMLQPVSPLRERYVLNDGYVDVMVIEGRSWGRRPVAVEVQQVGGIDAGLILFTAFVVHRLAMAASSAAGSSGAAVAATASC